MKRTRHKVSILIFCVLNILQVFGVTDNSHLSKGDQCKLDNNQSGICKEAKSCEYALNLVKQRRTNEVSRCQFQGRIPIVCCPQDRPATGPEPSYPKSKKFLTAICSDNSTRVVLNQNIVGGEPAGVGEFPFQVALGYTNQDGKVEYKCGGSLIADDIILTAAHCANRADVVPNTVKLGRVSLVPDEYDYGDGEDIEIESIKLHPKYSRFSRHNDIAIIKMKQPTKFSWPIETICLSQENHVLPKNLTITGYGRNDVDTLKTSDWLLRATVNIHPFQQCNEIFQRSGKPLVETQFCAAGYKGADACQGDSGGPVSYTITGVPYLYGVVSYGMGCGSEIPGIYTKVNQYLEWIDEEMYKIEQK